MRRWSVDQHFRNYKYRFELNTPAESWTDGSELVWVLAQGRGCFCVGGGW